MDCQIFSIGHFRPYSRPKRESRPTTCLVTHSRTQGSYHPYKHTHYLHITQHITNLRFPNGRPLIFTRPCATLITAACDPSHGRLRPHTRPHENPHSAACDFASIRTSIECQIFSHPRPSIRYLPARRHTNASLFALIPHATNAKSSTTRGACLRQRQSVSTTPYPMVESKNERYLLPIQTKMIIFANKCNNHT